MSLAAWLRAFLGRLAIVHLVRAGRGLATGRYPFGGEPWPRAVAPRRLGLEAGIDPVLALYCALLVMLPWDAGLPDWLGGTLLLLGPELAGARYDRDQRPLVCWTLVALGAALVARALTILAVQWSAPAWLPGP